jgi:hypothetical protein
MTTQADQLVSFMAENASEMTQAEFQQGLVALADYLDALEDLIDNLPPAILGVTVEIAEDDRRYRVSLPSHDSLGEWWIKSIENGANNGK